MKPNFTACGELFLNNSDTLYSNYTYNGSVRGIFAHHSARPVFITVQGCKHLCGDGIEYYSWRDASTTVTTWVSLNFNYYPCLLGLMNWMGSLNSFYRCCPSWVSYSRRHSRATRIGPLYLPRLGGSATLLPAFHMCFGTYTSLEDAPCWSTWPRSMAIYQNRTLNLGTCETHFIF